MPQPAKHAELDHPTLDVLAQRWSPYVFNPRPVEEEKLKSCLEAARWAASSYNEQPWTFLVARREEPEEFAEMLGFLVEANQAWAKNAGVLLLTVVCRTFQRNNKPNRVAEHDVGLAAGNFTVQATALGLAVHQMAGVELAKAKAAYQIPDTHDPYTGIALGYAGDPALAEEQKLGERDQSPRPRKPLSEIVFQGRWGATAKWLS
ncbi:MAG: nitroreductase family protein [Planctomycetes bacterium]|nr:nitroreductase family protein [Planctomycetota bacterium]